MSTLPPHPDTTLTLTPAERAAFDGIAAASGAATGWGNVVPTSATPQRAAVAPRSARRRVAAVLADLAELWLGVVLGFVLLARDARARRRAERRRR